MKKFRDKIWNDEVFEKYVKTLESTKENSLISNGLFTNVNKYRTKMNDQTGGNYIIEPIMGRLEGEPQNYDGVTDLKKGEGRDTYYQGKVALGRMQTWGEYNFESDLTGTNFKPEAQEVKDFWDEYKQKLTLLILKGIFSMKNNKDFVEKHTYQIDGNLTADGANRASQKALGDKKAKLDIIFMHSVVSTNLEGMNLIDYLKYTDASGVTRDLTIGTWNGKLVVVDDEMPIEYSNATYTKTTDTTLDNSKTYFTRGGNAGTYTYSKVDSPKVADIGNYYEMTNEGTPQYVSYMFRRGFFEFENIGLVTNKEHELARDPYDKGGRDEIITRRRWAIVPQYISYAKPTTTSPSNEDLANGENWELANNNDTDNKKYVDDKLVPIVRIISKG